MSYCRTHGSYSDSEDGCPYCKAAEERTERGLSDIAERLDELAERPNDPGDHICPHCRYKSLRRNATRCPLCLANPGPQYWADVDSQEQERRRQANAAAEQRELRAKAAAEEWARGEPARAAQAAKNAAARRANLWGMWYFGYLFPIAVHFTFATIGPPTERIDF